MTSNSVGRGAVSCAVRNLNLKPHNVGRREGRCMQAGRAAIKHRQAQDSRSSRKTRTDVDLLGPLALTVITHASEALSTAAGDSPR